MGAEEIGARFHRLLEYTLEVNATDLHICPGLRPSVRRNSLLEPVPETEKAGADYVANLVPLLLDKTKIKRLKKKGAVDFSYSFIGKGRFRANIYSQRGTLAMAIRALPFEIPAFESLGLPESVRSFVKKRRGLFLATGVSGSGKSTTLASLIDIINSNYNYHILTIEDPVEYLHSHKKSMVTQREIGGDCTTFSEALRSALREDPDVIMLGEMRDPETIAIALTAAETGHMVFSTLHTVGAAKSIDRIIDSFPPQQQGQIKGQLSTVLEGVVSQQLVPKAKGGGMVVASEVMLATPAVRNLIREGKHYQINNILQTGQADGMQLLDYDLARLYKAGEIGKEAAYLRAQDTRLLEQFIMRG
ncbi:MAG: type IV pilus twitching motility protein PilT [Christensenellales bacterium]|jgi:twitching motility protein PilT